MRRNEEILSQLRTLDTKLERLDVALITRYPDSSRAADSYEALRRALIASGSAASRHASDLIELATAIDDGANAQTVRLKISDLLQVLGITELPATLADQVPTDRFDDAFEVVGKEAHPRSAWIREEGVLRRGYVTSRPTSGASAPSPEPEAAADAAQADAPESQTSSDTPGNQSTEKSIPGETAP